MDLNDIENRIVVIYALEAVDDFRDWRLRAVKSNPVSGLSASAQGGGLVEAETEGATVQRHEVFATDFEPGHLICETP